jgi:two-component system, cell cycle sensor histidine kinase and response regulator CckA
MIKSGASVKAEGAGPAALGRSRTDALLTLALALLLAVAVSAAAWLLRTAAPLWLLVPGAVLALLGLFVPFGMMAGVMHIGRLPRQREFFDGLSDAIGDPFVVTDGRGRAVYANGSYVKLAAVSAAGRLVGMDMLYSGHPDLAEPIYRLAQAGLEGKTAEKEIRLPAGSTAPGGRPEGPSWLRINVAPVADAAGRHYTLWRLQDIGADRAKQEQAFARLQFIITYLDHAPAGFFSAKPGGKIDYLNATLAGWLGLDVAQAQSGGLTLAAIAGEDGARLLGGIAARAGEAVTESFEIDLKDKDGQPFPVLVLHRADFGAGAEPLPTRSLVIPRSVLPRRASSESSARLARLVNNAPMGIAEVDAAGILRQANAAFLALSPGARRGTRLPAIVTEAGRAELDAGLAAALASEATLHAAEVTIEGERPRTVQFTFAKLASGDDGAVVFAVDKTESKALEAQLAQGQKMQAVGQLASGIAHDFNNVLTPIIGFADLLLAKMRPTDPAFADVMNIKQNANRAANLVRQLLAFSRRQTLQPKVHSLTEALSDLGNLLGRVLGEKVGLKISHSRDLGLVLVDIHQFEQVIINLAVNARDAMSNGGTLTVRTYNLSEEESRTISPDLMPPGEYVVCELADTGSGIPKDILNKIWEPFFSTKDVGKGTGLGLSTVYGIIKQTGGFIFCDSEPGKGTTFRIYLPRHYPKPEAIAETKAETESVRADHTGKGRILLVEDEDAVRAFAVRALASRGFTVIEADSGERALEVIAADDKGFELILSDVVMPEMDGPTLLRELRKRGIKTKVIFISGYAEDAFEKNLEGQKDFAFLAKPFSLKQLVEKVMEVMKS